MTAFNKQKGASLVEAAVGIPVVLSMLFGIIQWGLILAAKITLLQTTATAGRMVAIGNPSYSLAQIRDIAVAAAAPYLTLTSANCSATGGPPGSTTVDTTVTCTYTMNLLFRYVVPGNVNGTLTLTSSTTAR